jgi:hypothetical protein
MVLALQAKLGYLSNHVNRLFRRFFYFCLIIMCSGEVGSLNTGSVFHGFVYTFYIKLIGLVGVELVT